MVYLLSLVYLAIIAYGIMRPTKYSLVRDEYDTLINQGYTPSQAKEKLKQEAEYMGYNLGDRLFKD